MNGPCGREAWETCIAQGFCPSVYRQGPRHGHQVINVQERTGARRSSDHSLCVPTRRGERTPLVKRSHFMAGVLLKTVHALQLLLHQIPLVPL